MVNTFFKKYKGVIENKDITTTIVIRNSSGTNVLNSVPNGTNIRLANRLEPLISSYERALFLPKFETSMFLSVNWDIIIPLIS